jgi:hypothetical protein
VFYEAECPVWTDAHVEESRVQELAIRNVLCGVEFGPCARDINRQKNSFDIQHGAKALESDYPLPSSFDAECMDLRLLTLTYPKGSGVFMLYCGRCPHR